MNDCIFCKIIKGTIPSEKVFEDGVVIAIVDINPICPGHTLVISKEHYPTLLETPSETLAAIAAPLKTVSAAVVKAMGADGFNLLENNHPCAGQAIPHIHFHIIPRKTGDTIRFNWQPKKYGQGDIQKVGKTIKEKLGA